MRVGCAWCGWRHNGRVLSSSEMDCDEGRRSLLLNGRARNRPPSWTHARCGRRHRGESGGTRQWRCQEHGLAHLHGPGTYTVPAGPGAQESQYAARPRGDPLDAPRAAGTDTVPWRDPCPCRRHRTREAGRGPRPGRHCEDQVPASPEAARRTSTNLAVRCPLTLAWVSLLSSPDPTSRARRDRAAETLAHPPTKPGRFSRPLPCSIRLR